MLEITVRFSKLPMDFGIQSSLETCRKVRMTYAMKNVNIFPSAPRLQAFNKCCSHPKSATETYPWQHTRLEWNIYIYIYTYGFGISRTLLWTIITKKKPTTPGVVHAWPGKVGHWAKLGVSIEAELNLSWLMQVKPKTLVQHLRLPSPNVGASIFCTAACSSSCESSSAFSYFYAPGLHLPGWHYILPVHGLLGLLHLWSRWRQGLFACGHSLPPRMCVLVTSLFLVGSACSASRCLASWCSMSVICLVLFTCDCNWARVTLLHPVRWQCWPPSQRPARSCPRVAFAIHSRWRWQGQ